MVSRISSKRADDVEIAVKGGKDGVVRFQFHVLSIVLIDFNIRNLVDTANKGGCTEILISHSWKNP